MDDETVFLTECACHLLKSDKYQLMLQKTLSILALLSLFIFAACSTTPREGVPVAEGGEVTLVGVPDAGESAKAPVLSMPAPTPVVEMPAPQIIRDVQIVLKTNRGDIEATLYATKTPVTVANFLNLAKRGYYDGLTFHRVIEDFMIQGGDPRGNGTGGPGYKFEDEIHPALRHNSAGMFSMANSGPRTNGSQFFITHGATSWLDGKHTVFGKVTKGQRVVDSIRKGDVIESISVLTSTDALFAEQKARIVEWNAVLQTQGL